MQAEQQYEQARGWTSPGDMRGAQESALMALEWRRDGLDRIAQEIRPALGDESEQADAAIEQIAAQMETFLASDVAWDTRVIPFIKHALDEHEIGGQEISRSQFLPDLELARAADDRDRARPAAHQRRRRRRRADRAGPAWLGPRLDELRRHRRSSPRSATGSPTSLAPAFTVNFTNQGENDEFDIKVTLRIEAEGQDPITTSETIPKVATGQSATAELPLEDQPPLDTAVTITRQRRARPRRGEDRQQPRRVPRAVLPRLTTPLALVDSSPP